MIWANGAVFGVHVGVLGGVPGGVDGAGGVLGCR